MLPPLAAGVTTAPDPPPQGLDLVPFLGLPCSARVAVLGDAESLVADLVGAGHHVERLEPGAPEPTRSCDALVVSAAALTVGLAAGVRDGAQLVVMCGRRQLGGVEDVLRSTGLSRVDLLGLDSVDLPTAAVTLGGAGASRCYVGRLRTPWSAREVARLGVDRVVAASPGRRRLYRGFLVLARHA